MKISDIFRKLADELDQQQDPARPDVAIQNPAQLSATASGVEVGTVNNNDAGAADDVMVPPLQLKTELLKRAVGVDNIYDAGEARADQAYDNTSDEIMQLKHRAGIPVAAVVELDNEELTDD